MAFYKCSGGSEGGAELIPEGKMLLTYTSNARLMDETAMKSRLSNYDSVSGVGEGYVCIIDPKKTILTGVKAQTMSNRLCIIFSKLKDGVITRASYTEYQDSNIHALQFPSDFSTYDYLIVAVANYGNAADGAVSIQFT